MALPLMPKATAVWLVENTSLTFDQIGEFCGLHPLEVQAIADGEVAVQMQGLDPIANGQLTLDLLERELAVGDGIEALHLHRDLAVGDRLHLEGMEAAELADLVEGERGVLDEPHGRGLRHQRQRHKLLLLNSLPRRRLAPESGRKTSLSGDGGYILGQPPPGKGASLTPPTRSSRYAPSSPSADAPRSLQRAGRCGG